MSDKPTMLDGNLLSPTGRLFFNNEDSVKTINHFFPDYHGNLDLNVGKSKVDINGVEKTVEEIFEELSGAAWPDSGGKPTVVASAKTFSTVSEMVKATTLVKHSRVNTRGYHTPSGIGGATYDIWDIDEYGIELGKQTFSKTKVDWVPDGIGDHKIEGTNLAAVLIHNGMFWAGQLGLLDPVENEYHARALGRTHQESLQKASEYVKRQIDYLHKLDGTGYRHILVLHVETGRYVVNGTAFLPAGVFLCGGSDWGATPCVEFIPMKNLEKGEDNIANYHPKPGMPVLLNIWEPNLTGANQQAIDFKDYVTSTGNRGNHFTTYVKLNDANVSQTLACDKADINTEVFWNASDESWNLKLSLASANGDKEVLSFKPYPCGASSAHAGNIVELRRHVVITDDFQIAEVQWQFVIGGAVIDYKVPKDPKATITLNRWGNNSTGLQGFSGSFAYPVMEEQWPLNNAGAEVDLSKIAELKEAPREWRYYPGTTSSIEYPTVTYLDDESKDDANGQFVGFGENKIWRLRDEFDTNDRTGYMFIWNSSPESDGTKPIESVYLAQYVGGASAITISNYETNDQTFVPGTMNPNGQGDLDPNWKPNYLRLINGYMTYGSGMFVSLRSERISTLIHRPSYDLYGSYYTDRHYIQDIECGIQRENDRWAIDINGAGDAVSINNVSFPVNHPSKYVPGTFYPMGEYADGPAKGIKFQTTAYSWPNWKTFVGTSTAGAEIVRIINGSVKLIGNRSISVSDSHFEFGNVICDNSSALIKNCYFSQVRNANYPDIDTRAGTYSNFGNTVIIENCEFHRGYDASHWPKTKYNIICSSAHTVQIKSAYQSWALGGNEGQEIAPAVGYRPSVPKGQIYPNTGVDKSVSPLPGWSRWSPYLARECTITRGVIHPKVLERTLDSFQGIGDVFLSKTSGQSEYLYWWDHFNNKPFEFGTYYYNCQWLLDKGDDTTLVLDHDFIPLGMNPSVGGKNTLSAERKATTTDSKTGVEPYTRPVLAFYIGGQSVPDGWMRFYRGKESGKYTHYVDIPAMSISQFDDNGSQMYKRDWIPFTNEVDEYTGTNMLPIQQVRADQWFNLKIRGGRYNPPSELPTTITGGWSPVITEKAFTYEGTKSGGGSESLHTRVSATWNDHFDKEVYCGLSVTGQLVDWSKERIVIPEGALSTITRAASSTGDYDLVVTYTETTGDKKEVVLARLKTGMSVNCIYSKGAWTTVNWSGFPKEYTQIITVPNQIGAWFAELNNPSIKEVNIVIDCDVYTTNPKSQDFWYGLEKDAPVGKRVTFTRPTTSKGSNTLNPYGYGRIIASSTDVDGNSYIVGMSNIPGDSFSVIKCPSGWVQEAKPDYMRYTRFITKLEDASKILPVDGCMYQENIFQSIEGDATKEAWVSLNPTSWCIIRPKNGARVRLEVGPQWKQSKVVIQLADANGQTLDGQHILTGCGEYAEYIYLDFNPYDPDDSVGKFYLVSCSQGVSIDNGQY